MRMCRSSIVVPAVPFWLTYTASADLAFAQANDTRREIVIRDMSRCRPAGALSPKHRDGHWQLISYEAGKLKGTMMGAGSLIEAPGVSLPLEVKGWYFVSVGIWNPIWAYDGNESVLKLKLTGDACFRVVKSTGPTGYQGTLLQEYAFGPADLTDRNLEISKRNGQKAYLAYVRLRPMSGDEVTAFRESRPTSNSRVLVASHDGAGFLTRGGGHVCRTREDVWAEVSKLAHEGAGWPPKVLHLFTGG